MSDAISPLVAAILKSKGVDDAGLEKLAELGLTSKEAFEPVGDASTLADITGFSSETANTLMDWAVGAKPAVASSNGGGTTDASATNITVEAPGVIKCVHCGFKQPHDYKTGDLCPNCGKQAEPITSCYWCHSTGTGQFCRTCGAEYVRNADYEIAVLLKREGYAKTQIVTTLKEMTDAEKETRITQIRSGRY